MFTKMGTDYNVRQLVVNNQRTLSVGETPYTTVKNVNTGKYWNTSGWQTEEYRIPIAPLNEGVLYSNSTDPSLVCVGVKRDSSGIVYGYNFPENSGEDEYYVTVNSLSGTLFITLSSVFESTSQLPISVNNYDLLMDDGTDCTVKDQSGNPISGVSVTVSNPDTLEVIANTKTNSKGEWNLILYAGTYTFSFERDGLISFKDTFTITAG